MYLTLSISTWRHFRSDDETVTTDKMYDANFSRRANPYVKFIHTVFTIAWHLSIIDTCILFLSPSLLFLSSRYQRSSSRSPPTPSLFLLPQIHTSTTSPQPSKMHQTNKTTQTAQRISMLFLSCRRATNEHGSPFFRPFFSNHCVLSVEQAPPVSMSPAT